MKERELIRNKAHHRYEFKVDGMTPTIEYIVTEGGNIYLVHTEIPYALAGRGIGTALVCAVLEDIERQGLKVVPLCGFVVGYIGKNPEWKRLLKEGINIE